MAVPVREKHHFNLGMEDWTEDEKENAPSRKRLKLSLSKSKPQAASSRWEFLTVAQQEALAVKHVPKNTSASTNWAVKNFCEWRKNRNERPGLTEEELVPDILSSTDPALLCKWLSVFVGETRKKDGTPYPAKSLYLLLTGVLRHMRTLNVDCPNFLDTNDKGFAKFHACLDNIFRDLRATGVGSSTKHAEPFTKEEETRLWEREVLGINTPRQLLRAVFFLNGRNFCLRGGEEHRQLKLSQLTRKTDPDRYIYTEHASKNRSGALQQMRVENKIVPVIANPEAGIRCHVAILDLYLSKIPASAVSKDVFYLQPVPKVPSDSSKPWFLVIPVGRNTLSTMVRDICTEGGIDGNKTNHSLRATGASSLFTAGVPEKIIQQRSGHLSLQGLRHYERVTQQQQLAVSRVLSSSENTSFDSELEKVSDTPVEPKPSKTSSFQPTPQMNFTGCTVNIFQGNAPQK